MKLKKKIKDWKKHPNALGSESQVSVIVGEIAAKMGTPVPLYVSQSLRTLALRGTMRDIAIAMQRNEEGDTPIPIFDVIDAGAHSCGQSWTEAIACITRYLDDYIKLLKKTDLPAGVD